MLCLAPKALPSTLLLIASIYKKICSSDVKLIHNVNITITNYQFHTIMMC